MLPRTLRLLLTPGEPAGVGPDLALRAALRAWPAELVAVADADLLRERAGLLGLTVRIDPADLDAAPAPHVPGLLKCLPVPLAAPAHPGRLDAANAGYVLETLRRAVAACRQHRACALVTGPVHKGIINEGGIPFTGHTEFLAELTGTILPVMMLATEGLRVALATTHLPLRAVPDAITTVRLERVIRVLVHDLRARFGIAQPRLLVCGLNPHAGEGGHLGSEEVEIIAPLLERLRQEGLQLLGPLPADTLFLPRYLDAADAVLAMYHDQGLPVLKHKGFGRAVNITLGLPMVRTSVDHGTALELAGTGQADCASLIEAINTALHLCRHA